MEAYKEDLIRYDIPFPVDIFIQDNLKFHVSVEPHWHECVEILYMLEGTANQQVNDRYFVVNKDDMVILNKGDIHSTYCSLNEDTKILVIKFLSDIINSSFSMQLESKYILAFLNKRHNQIYHLTDTFKNSIEVYNLMMNLYKEFIKKETGYEIFIKGYIYQLVACIIRNGIISIFDSSGSERDMAKFDLLFKYIENHYKENIGLKKAAALLNFSDSYFSRYFKKVTGRTFKEYVDFVKICEVEKLIVSQDMNISEAAYEAGFCNVSSFNRVFKRVRGYLPRDIKKSKTAKK